MERTLPPRIRYDRHATIDQPVEADQAGLDGAAHGAHDDQLYVTVCGEVGLQVLAQRGGLLPAEVGEGGVGEGVVGYFGGVSTGPLKGERMADRLTVDVMDGLGVADEDESGRHGGIMLGSSETSGSEVRICAVFPLLWVGIPSMLNWVSE